MTPLTPLQQHPCAGPQGVGIATLIFRYFLRYFSSTHRTDLSRFRGTFHSFDPVGFATTETFFRSRRGRASDFPGENAPAMHRSAHRQEPANFGLRMIPHPTNCPTKDDDRSRA